ncbi:MAG: aldolase [Alphaproteobacteria bacterium RIFOXYD12_FULL_60_8]|nr:MAG: aldolase [Alphaproteobacteria bacterium RIFOXYD12_FULL_60_8]
MNDGFGDREKAFEAKYHVDQEVRFRVNARRVKLFGLWVADQLGLAGGGAEVYAKSLAVFDVDECGDDDIIGKVIADLAEKGIDITEGRIKIKLDKYSEEARRQIMQEVESGKQELSHEP